MLPAAAYGQQTNVIQTYSRLALGLVLGAAAVANPIPTPRVSAASAPAGGGRILVYQSSWQSGKLDWSAHHMKWTIAGGILRLRPMLNGTRDAGWLVAPYRTTSFESFAIVAVVRFTRNPDGTCCTDGLLGLVAHASPAPWLDSSGVTGAYVGGNGLGIFDSLARQDGSPVASDFVRRFPPRLGEWTTVRLRVRYVSFLGRDLYDFEVNLAGVSAVLGDWTQYNRIALKCRVGAGVEVKSIKVYKLLQ